MKKNTNIPVKVTKWRLSAFSVIIVFCMLSIIGACFVPMLNIQLNPSTSLPQTTIDYYWDRASARVIEQQVTSPLEGVLGQIKGVNNISSASYKGSGSITIQFDKNIDPDAVRFEISTLIRQVYPALPEGVSYPTVQMRNTDGDNGSVLTYTIISNATPILIHEYAEDYLAPKLSILKGVNDVRVYGGTPFEWLIEVDNAQANALGVSASDISTAINNHFRQSVIGIANDADGAGKFEKPIRVFLELEAENAEEWNRLPVKKIDERIVFLSDIAQISYSEKPPGQYHRINGMNSVNMVISPEDNSNNIKVANSVKEEVEKLKTLLPPEYYIKCVSDSTVYIKKELAKIGWRSLFSIVILLLFVLLITRKWRYLFLIFISILVNLLIAAWFYSMLNIEIHLYALAGITVSFGIIIDNSIVMIDHLRLRGNKKVFMAILAATLTTIGALSVIFFLKEGQRTNLVDFSLVIMVNLFISIAIALFFIPALLEKLPLKRRRNRKHVRYERLLIKSNLFYARSITFSKRFKWIYIVVLVLGFGLPVHWLPSKIEKENFWARTYNKTLGNEWFDRDAKPVLAKVLGGTFRLFTENVYQNSFYSEPSRTQLNVQGSMPEGCSIQQHNEAVKLMENELIEYDEIESFQTTIWNAGYSSITILFTDSAEFTGFPYFLKEHLTSKAIQLGGVDWGITGVGRGFSNALSSGYRSQRIQLEGYNYDQLYAYATMLGDSLEQNERVKELEIAGGSSWYNESLQEYFIDFDPELFALKDITLNGFVSYLRNKLYSFGGQVFIDEELQPVTIISSDFDRFRVWNLKNEPVGFGEQMAKLSSVGQIAKRKTGNSIHKNNQQYHLEVAYDFLGAYTLASMVREEHIEKIEKELPLGYRVIGNNYYGWNKADKSQYYLILLVIGIIYFICAILLESFTRPLAIISMIPISFVGVFLTFYLFDINFDQGGFASFILLCGIVVNSGLYILNDYNQVVKSASKSKLRCYIDAFNHKIMPIFLTIISTILGLVPFVWAGQNEVFWFSFASGAIGGLIFSLVALFIYLPLFLKLKD